MRSDLLKNQSPVRTIFGQEYMASQEPIQKISGGLFGNINKSQEPISKISGGLFGKPNNILSEKSNLFMQSSGSPVTSSKNTTSGSIFAQPPVSFPSDRVLGGKLNEAVRLNFDEPLEVTILKQKHKTQKSKFQSLLDEATVRYENQKQFNVQLQQKLCKQREDYQKRIEEMMLAADLPLKGIKIHQKMFKEEYKWNIFYRKSEQLIEITDKLTIEHLTQSTQLKQSIYNYELSLLQSLNEKIEVFTNCVVDIISCEQRKGIINLKRLETLKESLRRCLQDESKDHENHGSVLREEETKKMFLPIEEKIEKQMNSLRELSGVRGEINDVGQKWAIKEQKKVDESKEDFSSMKRKLQTIQEEREAQALEGENVMLQRE